MPTTASWYHANVKSISRGKGKTYVGLVAYATGEKLQNPETGRQDKRNHPGDVVSWGVVAPSHAPSWLTDKTQIERLAQAVQASETRSNAQFSNHWDIALWRNGTPEQHEALARRISERYVDRYGTLVVYAVHAPSGEGSEHNWHLHLAPNMRRITEDGFGKKATEITDGKTRQLETEWVRRMVAEETNAFLKSVNSDERVSHQSYAQRGILKDPMVHLGAKAWQAEKRGVNTKLGDLNRTARAENAAYEAAQEKRAENIIRYDGEIVALNTQRLSNIASGKAPMELTPGQAERRDTEIAEGLGRIDQTTEAVAAWWIIDPDEVADARARWAEACGKYSDLRDPYGSMATAARAEGAKFRHEQEELRQAEARESDPAKREMLQIRRHIEASSYMELTSERLAGISKVIGGPRDGRGASESEEFYREEAAKYREIGKAERQKLSELRELMDTKNTEKLHEGMKDLNRQARENPWSPRMNQTRDVPQKEQSFGVPVDLTSDAPNRDRPQNDQRSGLNHDPWSRNREEQQPEDRPQHAARDNPYERAARDDSVHGPEVIATRGRL
jgi:hypothetical protein